MDNLEFIIPSNKLELMDSGSDAYFIDEIIPVNRVEEALKNAKYALKSEGPSYIIEHFPVYYAILTHSEKIHKNLVSKAFDDLTGALRQTSNNLDLLLEESEIQPEVAQKYLKTLKMLMYSYTSLIVLVENNIRKKQKDQLLLPSKQKGRKQAKADMLEEVEVDKTHALNNMSNILKKQVNRLWDPPICEESFINIIADVLYTYMQDPAIKNDDDLQGTIFHMFGDLLKNYNYSLTFRVRIVQLIKSKENEHLIHLVPQGIKTLVEEYNCKSLVRELVRELTEWQADENIQDVPATKHCSNILVEMTILMPELMIPEVIYLIKYLNHESYTLRICVLTIITEVIIIVLCNEDMSDEQKETRAFLLKELDTHILDTNAHVRAKVLQLWAKLQFEGAVPLTMVTDVLEKASRRLSDRAVLVRKSAVTLMIKFVESNPFAAVLNLDDIEKELEIERKKIDEFKKKNGHDAMERIQKREEQWSKIEDDIRKTISNRIGQATQLQQKDMMDVNSDDLEYVVRMYLEDGKYIDAFIVCHTLEGKIKGMKESRKDLNDEEQIEFYVTLLHGVYMDIKNNAVALITEEIGGLASVSEELQAEIDATEKRVAYLKDVATFLRVLDRATPSLLDLLESAAVSDVSEAIEYFIVAFQFQLKGSIRGLEVMLDLIRTDDKDRKNAVADAYKRLFLQNEEKKNSKDFADHLVKGLIQVLKTVNLASLSNFGTIVSEWVTSGLLNNAVVSHLWSMFTGNIPDISSEDVRAALQLLSFAGIGRPTVIEKNMKLVSEIAFKDKGMNDPNLVIIACQMLSQLGEPNIKVDAENPPARIAVEEPMWDNLLQIIVHNFATKNSETSSVIQAAVEVIYQLCRFPDALCEKLIRKLHPLLSKDEKINSGQLSCFIYMLGEVALKQFAYLDITVYKELKRRNYIRDKKQKKNKVDLNSTRASASVRTAPFDADESFMEGAQADDTDSDFILKVCENDLVNKNLLGHFVPLLKRILKSQDVYDNEHLQTSTTLTMLRYMLISEGFCRQYIQFLMTILDKSKYSGVKNNILISIADLLHRYPNIIEPWTLHLYKCVRDPTLNVRLTSVTVITSLLVQHMLRVKGNIAEIALCINDESDSIVQIATRCFYSLSQQNPNPIYNILPDIISNLSNESQQIDEETFRKVMKFLIKHIDKDKQMEPLVEKLCARISATVNVRHLRDVSYCLTIINHNEKSIEKLIENYPNYKLKLEDEEVLQLFISVVEKHKNAHKEEMKNSVRKLDELLKTGKTTEDAQEQGDDKNKKKLSRRGRQKKPRRS